MKTHSTLLLIRALCLSLLCACDATEEQQGDDEPLIEETEDQRRTSQGILCEAETIERDSFVARGIGAEGEPAGFGELPPGAIVSSTYLRVQDNEEAAAAFDERMGPIIGQLSAPDAGLLGLSLRVSMECNTARTLTVWENEEAMMKFVMSAAHLEAIASTAEISRGGSITDTWPMSTLPEVEWTPVLARFSDHQGPVY